MDLAARLNIGRDSLVLDYGCGVGRVSKALIERFGCRVVGVDLVPSMRQLAIQYVQSERFAAIGPEMLRAFPGAFDAALSVWVLQHVYKPRAELRALQGALKPQAKLLIVNEEKRCVPTEGPEGSFWIDDGLDIRKMMDETFVPIDGGRLDAKAVAPTLLDRAYYAYYGNGE